MSRTKGRAYEQRVARILRAHFPEVATEIARSIQSRGGGKEGADVTFPGLHLELQHAARPDPEAKLSQAIRDASKREACIPVAITQENRCSPVVTLRLGDLAELAGGAHLPKVAHLTTTLSLAEFLVVIAVWREREQRGAA